MLYCNVAEYATSFRASTHDFAMFRVCSEVPGGTGGIERQGGGLRGRLPRRTDHPAHESPKPGRRWPRPIFAESNKSLGTVPHRTSGLEAEQPSEGTRRAENFSGMTTRQFSVRERA